MSKPDGGPAFPMMDQEWKEHPGLTLRDHFAAAALDALIGHELASGSYKHICPQSAGIAARNAYEIADAMLAQREKP